MNKPQSLSIKAENGRLVGTDINGCDWAIRWCGNGAYSHWVLYPNNGDIGEGFYVYYYNSMNEELIQQIKVAELKYGIFS